MTDIDIDPFGEHESRTEELTDESIFLDRLPQEDHHLGNQTEERKKHHLEEESLKEPN